MPAFGAGLRGIDRVGGFEGFDVGDQFGNGWCFGGLGGVCLAGEAVLQCIAELGEFAEVVVVGERLAEAGLVVVEL